MSCFSIFSSPSYFLKKKTTCSPCFFRGRNTRESLRVLEKAGGNTRLTARVPTEFFVFPNLHACSIKRLDYGLEISIA